MSPGRLSRKKCEEISELLSKSGKMAEILVILISKFPGQLLKESQQTDQEQILYRMLHDLKIYEICMSSQLFSPFDVPSLSLPQLSLFAFALSSAF